MGVGLEVVHLTFSFLLAFCWPELSHVHIPNGKGGWERFFSFAPRKERNQLKRCGIDKMRNLSTRKNKITLPLEIKTKSNQ